MKTILKISICILLLDGLTNVNVAFAQTAPGNDPHWQYQTTQSDEFNSGSLNLTKWCALNGCVGDWPPGSNPNCSSDCYNWSGNDNYVSSNVIMGASACSLRITGPPAQYWPPQDQCTTQVVDYCPNTPCVTNDGCYNFFQVGTVGGIGSTSENAQYGYLEIYAQLPGFTDAGGTPRGDKFNPSFWMYHEEAGPGPQYCKIVQDEIDILESWGCSQYYDAKTNYSGWHDEYTDEDCPNPASYKVGNGVMVSPTPLYAGFHKFAVEWTMNKMIFYFDDVPYFENYNYPSFTMDPLRVIIGCGVDGGSCNFHPETVFPQYMIIDYYRYWKLALDCSTNSVLINSTDITNYVYSVKSTITFGNGTGSISFNNGDQKYYRAVNSITVNDNLTVPLGAELSLLPTSCN